MKYPAKTHARKVADLYKKLGGTDPDYLIYSAASETKLWPHCDQTVPLRQSRYFNYITGAFDKPDAHAVYDTKSDKLTLYLPPIDEDDVMWSGMPISLKDALAAYDVDAVEYSDKLEAALSGRTVLAVDASETYPAVKACPKLLEAFDESRVTKDEFELNLLRKAAQITDNSHMAVMSAMPIQKNEGHIHAEFVYHAMRQGSKNQAYDPICCAGTNAGTLHYVKNDEDIEGRLLVLIDAGAEWQTYAADVTRVFPLTGEWTKESREIYELVLDMQKQALDKIRPGINYEELHIQAHRILINKFLELGIFKNGTADEIFESGLSAAFYPHGLGHMLGMDTHDPAGWANYEDPDPKLRYLRIRRVLEENMVLTVEPGCYFNNFLIDPHRNGQESTSAVSYLDEEVLKKYMPVGGVRIEDDIVVTKDGHENFTKMTKDPEQISKIVKDGIQKGRGHFHCVV